MSSQRPANVAKPEVCDVVKNDDNKSTQNLDATNNNTTCNGSQSQQQNRSAKQIPPSMNNLVGNLCATAIDLATTPLDPSKMTSLMSKLCPGVDFSFINHNQSSAGCSSDTSNQQSPPGFVQDIMSALKTPTNVHPNNPPIPATPAPNSPHQQEDNEKANETGLFDAVEKHRFPQGYMCYEVNQPDFKPSYSAVCYSHRMKHPNNNTRLQKMKCLGIFNCPVDKCQFVSNSLIPKKRRSKDREPDGPSGKKICSVHDTPLIHVNTPQPPPPPPL